MEFSQVFWDAGSLKNNRAFRSVDYGIPSACKKTRYPLRMLRYWFCLHFLRKEYYTKDIPLSICEVGIGNGQLKLFCDEGGNRYNIAWQEWGGIDCVDSPETIEKCGYSNFSNINLEAEDFHLDKEYDVIILLHVLEHLTDPNNTIYKLSKYVKKGGVIIGGFPVLPDFFLASHEKRLRSKAERFGHVSAFSPRRLRTIAERSTFDVEFAAGAYLMRRKGFLLENSVWWMRFNLLFGALFPSFAGELYWVMRKPCQPGTDDPRSAIQNSAHA
jgi:SAM-dependent methyltransferase